MFLQFYADGGRRFLGGIDYTHLRVESMYIFAYQRVMCTAQHKRGKKKMKVQDYFQYPDISYIAVIYFRSISIYLCNLFYKRKFPKQK